MQYIYIWILAIVLSIWFAKKRSSVVPKGETINDPLTTKERVISFVLLALNPVLSGWIIYANWKKVLPKKARQFRVIVWIVFAIYLLVIGIVMFSATKMPISSSQKTEDNSQTQEVKSSAINDPTKI